MMQEVSLFVLIQSDKEREILSECIKEINRDSKLLNLDFKVLKEAPHSRECLKQFNSSSLLFIDQLELERVSPPILEELILEVPIIAFIESDSEALARDALRSGAIDYLTRGKIERDNLWKSLLSTIERASLFKELEVLRMNQATNLKMATLGEVAGGIAHEINNPLTIIMGYSDRVLKMEINTPDDIAKVRDYSRKVIDTSVRIAKIVKSLKAISRKETLGFERSDLSEIIRDTLNLCEEKFKVEMIDLVVDIREPRVEVECVDVQISQVVLNLLINSFHAVKGTEDSWVKLVAYTCDGNLIIRISDSGKITDKDIVSKLFSPFFTTKDKGEGTGLGLSVSRNIILNHGGSLEFVEGESNTTFEILLPLVSPEKRDDSHRL